MALPGCARAKTFQKEPPVQESASLRRLRQVFARIPETLDRNHKTFAESSGPVSGFGAGQTYPQIWLRDSAWIVDAAAAYYPPETLTSWLDLHLANASADGRLRDWVAKGSANAFREWAPRAASQGDIAFDTNSNESDQEPSAALALCRVERLIGGSTSSAGGDARATRTLKAIAAMNALVRARTDLRTGLIWSGLTADWGDVSPLYPDQRAIYLDALTPRTLSLYSNVMAYGALACLSALDGPKARQEALSRRAAKLRDAIRSVFWMQDLGAFRIRRALDPEPRGFSDDDDRFALGGNALAVLFGVADDNQASAIFELAERLRVAQNASTVSTTLVPPYPSGVFQHPAMREPFQYQNGGQWDWFGAALIQAEFERGHAVPARVHLHQMVSRILRAGPGIHEWYDREGLPQGSAAYAASAASIHNAVVTGLMGVSRELDGYHIVLRSGETLLPFDIPQTATGGRLVLSQTVTEGAIEVNVSAHGSTRVTEVCSVTPPGTTPQILAAPVMALPQTIRKNGQDLLICADTSASPQTIRVRFGIAR